MVSISSPSLSSPQLPLTIPFLFCFIFSFVSGPISLYLHSNLWSVHSPPFNIPSPFHPYLSLLPQCLFQSSSFLLFTNTQSPPKLQHSTHALSQSSSSLSLHLHLCSTFEIPQVAASKFLCYVTKTGFELQFWQNFHFTSSVASVVIVTNSDNFAGYNLPLAPGGGMSPHRPLSPGIDDLSKVALYCYVLSIWVNQNVACCKNKNNLWGPRGF